MKGEGKRQRLQVAALHEHAALVERSAAALRHSLGKCELLGLPAGYSLDELERFEALNARFARTADLYPQKLLKSMFIVLREDAVGFLDQARLAEQLRIIESADDLASIRDWRNTIAHEYAVANLNDIFQSTLTLSRTLLAIVHSTLNYIHEQVPPPRPDWPGRAPRGGSGRAVDPSGPE